MCGVQLNRKIDYLGEFLNALITVVHGYMLADVLLVGWLVGHERKSPLYGASYLYT